MKYETALTSIWYLRYAAPMGNGITLPLGRQPRNGRQSGSCNSSGLLSHHIRGTAEANGNGNGYSSRHSSELSADDDWEARPPSASAINKVCCSSIALFSPNQFAIWGP